VCGAGCGTAELTEARFPRRGFYLMRNILELALGLLRGQTQGIVPQAPQVGQVRVVHDLQSQSQKHQPPLQIYNKNSCKWGIMQTLESLVMASRFN
jgi:hypothetical protein